MTVHHIGYLVKDIQKARETFGFLGYTAGSEVMYDEYRDVYILFMHRDGYTVELVSPGSGNSVVAGLMKRLKNSPYHICYETENFDEKLAELEQNGFLRIGDPCPAPAIDGRKVCFLQSARIGLIEVLEA